MLDNFSCSCSHLLFHNIISGTLSQAREPLYSNSAVNLWWLQSTRAQNSAPSCSKGLYFGQYFTFENIHCELLSLISPAVYLLDKIFCGFSDSCHSARVMPKMCFFFLKKRMKEFFAYVLEFMLTLAKMQNNSALM